MSSSRDVAFLSRRLARLVEAGQRRVQVALNVIEMLAALDDEVVTIDGESTVVRALKTERPVLGRRVDAEGGSRRYDRSSRRLRIAGYGLLMVNALSLVLTAGALLRIDWGRPEPATLVDVIGLSVLVVGAQALLATHLGLRLWSYRHADVAALDRRESPSRDAVVLLGASFLVLVSMFAASAVLLHVQAGGAASRNPEAAVAFGLVLGVAVFVAPLCVVADLAHGPSPDRRRLHEVGQVLRRSDASRRRLDPRARCALVAADARLAKARLVLAAAMDRAARQQEPACHRSWTMPVEQLAVAVATAHQAYAALVEPAGPGGPDPLGPIQRNDLDLAG